MPPGTQPVVGIVRCAKMTSTEFVDKFHWIGTIETASGLAANVVELEPEMVYFHDITRSLSHICRYNGHVPSFYSVAEHSVRVSWWIRREGGTTLEQLAGLMHDSAEAYVGDMVRPLKRHPIIGYQHQIVEDSVTSVIAAKFGFPYPFPEIVHEADKALYYWEVETIRSGVQKGWSPDAARSAFFDRYNYLLADLNAGYT